MKDNGRDVVRSIDEIEIEREREILAALDQVEADLLDNFTVRPMSAQASDRPPPGIRQAPRKPH